MSVSNKLLLATIKEIIVEPRRRSILDPWEVSQDAVAKPDPREKLAKIFYKLAAEIVADQLKRHDEDLCQELVMLGFDKLTRFNVQSGKALNYFVTCMMGHVRCVARSSKNYEELKRKYASFLREKT